MRSMLVIAAIFMASPVRAEPKDIADLFPADSLFYVEANQVGAVAKELAAFLKGTRFDDQSLSLDRIRQMQKKNESIDTATASMIPYCFGAGMLKEAERFAGLAGGITGFDKQGEPEFIVVLRTGDSQIPGYFMKAFISANVSLQSETTVEGIRLYQQRGIQFEANPNGNGPNVAKTVYSGPCYAYQPGIVLFGSGKEIVAATIRRLKEKERSPSLFSNGSFKSLVEKRSRPGLLLYADAKSLFSRLDSARQQGRGFDAATWYVVKRLLPPKSVRTLTGRLDVNEQGFGLDCFLEIDEKTPGLLASLVDGQSITAADLKAFANDVPFAVTVRLPSGDNRFQKFLSVIDSFVNSTGGLGPSASEIVQDLEERKILSRPILQMIDRVTLALPSASSWGKNGLPIPSILVHAESAAAIDAVAVAFPTVLEVLGGQKGEAVTETIEGVKIQTMESKASPLGKPILSGRVDKTFGVGMDRKLLAACLANANTTAKATMDAAMTADQASVVGIWNWSSAAKAMAPQKSPARSSNRRSFINELGDGSFAMFPVGHDSDLKSLARALVVDSQSLPPTVAGLSRHGNELRFVVNQRDPKKARAKLVSRWLDWLARLSLGQGIRDDDLNDMDLPIMFPPGGFFQKR